MTKKNGKRLLIVGTLVVMATFPLYLSWMRVGHVQGSPRAHYVGGLSWIAELFGAKETSRRFGEIADRIYEDRILVQIEVEDETEMDALYEKASRLNYGSRLMTRRDPEVGVVEFEIDREYESSFMDGLLRFRNQLRDAQQVEAPDAE